MGNEDNYFTYKGVTMYIAPRMRNKADKMISKIKRDGDAVVLLFGNEGSGKSKLGRQLGAYFASKLGTEFNLDNIHFNSKEYRKIASTSPKRSVHILDEARRDLGKSNRGKERDTFFNYLSENRDENQVHIIILPAFSDISEFIAIHRAKCIIRTQVRRIKGHEYPGYYRLIKTNRKSKLAYIHQHKYMDPLKSMRSEMLFFPNKDIVDEEKYKKKKREHKLEKYVYGGEDDKAENDVKLTERDKQILSSIEPKNVFSPSKEKNEYNQLKKFKDRLLKSLEQNGSRN